MIDIDVKTLFIFSTAANIFIIGLFAIYVKLYKVKNPIIYIFILSRILGIIFLIILSLREGVPKPLGIVLNTTINLFIVFYELYCISFVEKAFNKKHFKKFILFPLLFSIIGYFFINSAENNRITVMSLSVAIMYGYTAYILIAKTGKTKIQNLAGYLFAFGSLMLIIRSLGAIYIDGSKIYSSHYILLIPLIFFLILNFIIPLILLFILNEKDTIKLQELNKSKDQFFSIIAHDLKGPFGGLQQIGELLWLNKSDINNETREKLTESLYQNSKNTFNLLDNLLKWANANSGLIVFKPSKINLHQIVHTNLNLFNAKIRFKNLELICDFHNELFVHADIDMIDTVIRNIISNAIKFTPENGKIEISLDKINQQQNVCTIVISDSGVGLDKNAQQKVFEIDSTITTLGTNKEKGTGLGLKLCKEFLNINYGAIWIESEVNKGTSVYISLPLKAA